MLSVLASLVFVAAAIAAVAVVRATWSQYRDMAFANIAALDRLTDEREFRVSIAATGRKPVLAGNPSVRRQPHRAAPARIAVRWSAARRAAA